MSRSFCLALVWATLGLVAGDSTALAAEFPYVAYINTTDVYVRSGPGRDYYPTDKLQKGEKVEVYRHDPGGWLAIRPPRQSYSWVSARHLDPAEEGLALANTPRVVVRVGSAFSDTRDVIQVRLEKGEKVEVLESPTSESPWYKIAPPAGEFRWVFSKYVDRDLPSDLAFDEREATGQSHPEARFERAPREIQLASGYEETGDESSPPATGPIVETQPRAKAAFVSTSSNTIVSRELDRLEVELSAIMAEDISTWDFADLKQRADTLLNQANGPQDRGRVRVLIDKLGRFDDIRQRHASLRRPAAGGEMLAVAEPRRAVDPRFDGSGRLSPVVTQKSGGPQYALVDANNAVISFITPAPGVNLRPYVNKEVGVNGQRGYMTDLQRPHISAQRVTLLDTPARY